MGFWEKSVRVFKCLCENGRQGVRRTAQQTGLSKRSVHRLTQAMARRDVHPESWRWETADGPQGASEAQNHVEVKRAGVERWEGVHSTYRDHLEILSLTLHPFHLHDSSPQTSAQVSSRLHAAVAAVETLAQAHQFPVRHDMVTKVRHPLPALAALADFWWAGVDQDLEQAAISAPWRQWAREFLLPWVSWEHQVAHTRCARRKAKLQRAWAEGCSAFDQHVITQRLAPYGLAAWQAWATGAGHGFSACLVSGGRPQRCSGTTPSPSVGIPEAAVQGVDRPA